MITKQPRNLRQLTYSGPARTRINRVATIVAVLATIGANWPSTDYFECESTILAHEIVDPCRGATIERFWCDRHHKNV